MITKVFLVKTVYLKHYFSTSWKKQPYTRGTYTAIAVGASQGDIENLAQPLFRNLKDKKVCIYII